MALSAVAALSWLTGALWLMGVVGVPTWLLVTARRLRHRGRRIRGAFWGAVAGHLVGDLILLGALLQPPLSWPRPGPAWILPVLLTAPPLMGFTMGLAIGRGPTSRGV